MGVSRKEGKCESRKVIGRETNLLPGSDGGNRAATLELPGAGSGAAMMGVP